MKRITSTGELFGLLKTFDSVFEPPLSEDVSDLKKYAEKLIENGDTLVIEEGDSSAGFISFYANDEKQDESFIVLLAVRPEFQGKGLAQELLEGCLLESAEKSKTGVKLEVMKNNDSAMRFYKRNKFRVSEETNRGSVYMTRTLL